MRKTGVLSLCALSLALSGAATAQTTPSTNNDPAMGTIEVTTGIILSSGPRAAPGGLLALNIEGTDNGVNASYGLVRFDLTRLRNQFNTTFGANRWRVTQADLQMT